MVSLGIDLKGTKQVLGFWEGATENSEICKDLFADLERRGLRLSKRIIWVTDGGSGVIKALKERFGKKLIHQRCTIHKDRNIQKHLPKKYRRAAHRQFRTALEQTNYTDAKEMLLAFEKWLRKINESAADSLLEAIEEILTMHRLEVPALLRKTLHSTNPIESMFSTVRDCEHNIKRYRGSSMAQRWLAAMCSHIPNRGEQMVRYYGYYSNVSRGKRKETGTDDAIPCILEPEGNVKAVRKSWARLIQKIYEVDPLVCPKCKGIMRIISFIEDQQIIRDILTHLGLWLIRSRPPPKICAAITLFESKASDSYAHPPHQHADAYADPQYSWDDYIQS